MGKQRFRQIKLCPRISPDAEAEQEDGQREKRGQCEELEAFGEKAKAKYTAGPSKELHVGEY